MSRPTPPLLATYLLLLGGCGDADDFAQICALYVNDSLHGSVVDARGMPVPIQKVTVRQGGHTRDCDFGGSDFICSQLDAGKATLEVNAADHLLSAEAKLSWNPGEEGCHASGPPVELLVEERCPDPAGLAITGSVMRDGEALAVHSVLVAVTNAGFSLAEEPEIPSWSAPCTVDNAHFSCPALTPYPASYTLSFAVGASRFEQHVDVKALSCTVLPSTLGVEMSALDCFPRSSPLPAIQGRMVSANLNAPLPAISKVRARMDGGSFFACETYGQSYACLVGKPPGGGRYDVELEAGVQTYTDSVDVIDNGCYPEPVQLDFEYL